FRSGNGGKCLPSAPVIVTQPANQIVAAGRVASFSVTAAGTQPFSYQWFKEGTSLPAQTNSALSLVNVQTPDAANYSVLVANSGGSVRSSKPSVVVTGDHF